VRSITEHLQDLQKQLLTVVGNSPEAAAERERIQRRMRGLQEVDFDSSDGLGEND
jgi:hypothetical protein